MYRLAYIGDRSPNNQQGRSRCKDPRALIVISGVGQNTFAEPWDLAPVGSSAMAIALSTLSKGDRLLNNNLKSGDRLFTLKEETLLYLTFLLTGGADFSVKNQEIASPSSTAGWLGKVCRV